MSFSTVTEAFTFLEETGTLEDNRIDLAESALALALLFHPGISVDRYRQHLVRLSEQLADTLKQKLENGAEDSAQTRADCLIDVIHGQNEYAGDEENYDDIQNADMIRVIDRRKGLPVAIGLLYLIVAAPQKWDIAGLSFPGHFLVRLEKDGERLILDPFRKGQIVGAPELRVLLKSILGDGAELSHEFYNPVSGREVLIRLENNLKKRLIESEEYAQALQVVEAMRALAPDEYRLLLDQGVLYAKLNRLSEAQDCLKDYIDRTPYALDKEQAQQLLLQIKDMQT